MQTMDALGRDLASWIVGAGMWTAALLVVALLADRLLRRFISPGARMFLFGAVFVRAALPLDFASPLGLLPALEPSTLTLPVLGETVAAAPAAGSAPVVIAEVGWSWGLAVLGVYVLGAAVLLVALARTMLRQRRVLRRCTHRPVAGGPDVLEHPNAGPFAAGGRVVIPRRMFDYLAADELLAVIRHERAHLAHGDPWIAAALAVTCALAWPLLPLWIAARRVRFLMELRADGAAVDGLGALGRRTYVKLMLRMAALGWHVPSVSPGFGPVAALEARVAALGSTGLGPVWLQGACTAVIGVAVLCCTGHGLGHDGDDETESRCGIPVVKPLSLSAADAALAARLRGQLARAGVDESVPQHVRAEADAAGLSRVAAEARLTFGLQLRARGDYARAEQQLEEAAWTAASKEHDGVAAVAAGELVTLGLVRGPGGDGISWYRHYAAVQRRIGIMALPNEPRMLPLLIAHFEAEGDPATVDSLQRRLAYVQQTCGQ